ncbi:MAG TPA: hypothetical protein VH328_13905 [Burkholderiaceae bacterium]|nr:hypothetical protein [Burkholderiaceae bacterium]
MNRLAASLVLAGIALAGCESPRLDDNAPPAQAVVAGSHVDDAAAGIETFRVDAIAGRPMGRMDDPSKTLGVDARYSVDAGRLVRVEFEGLMRYSNPLYALIRGTQRVEGSVEFTPKPNARYVVRGHIDAQGSAAWLEDDATHEMIGQKFTAVPKPTELRENTL